MKNFKNKYKRKKNNFNNFMKSYSNRRKIRLNKY